MKIVITSQGKDLQSQVDPRFGRCQNFILFDTEKGDFEAMENPCISAGGGAGILTAQVIAEKGIEAVLTGNVGPNAFQTLSAADIHVYTGVSGTIMEAVERFKSGLMEPQPAPSVDAHHGMASSQKVSQPIQKKRIAVAAEDNGGLEAEVSSHFGRCPFYVLIDTENETIVSSSDVENPFYGDHGPPGQVPAFIRDQKADVIIAGGMGQRAVSFFEGFGIEVATGAEGNVKTAVENYLKGTLAGTAPCKHDSCH